MAKEKRNIKLERALKKFRAHPKYELEMSRYNLPKKKKK